ITGIWESNWGPVSLQHDRGADNLPVAITGSYVPEDGKKAMITKGTYDPVTGRLEFSFVEPWVDVTGSADLQLSSDGNRLSGAWSNSAGESGVWTLTRKPNAAAENKDATPADPSSLAELQRLIALQQKNVELVENRFEAGIVTSDEVNAAEIDLLEAKIRLAE